jgi:hypothetical protein
MLKKFVAGVAVGAILTATTAVYASDAVQAVLFPVKYWINGKEATPTAYETINYKDSAYVPLRFVSDKLGAAVVYDDVYRSITLDSGFTVVDPENLIKAGHLRVTKTEGGSVIEGQLYFSASFWEMFNLGIDSMESTGTLVFWNAQGEPIGEAPYQVNVKTKNDQIVPFRAECDVDVTGYAVATLENTTPYHLSLSRPYIDTKDPDGKMMVGVGKLAKGGEYTVGTMYVGTFAEGKVDIEATIAFLDDQGEEIGHAAIRATDINGPIHPDNPTPVGERVTFIAKGDVTNYASYAVHVDRLIRR